MENGWRQVLIEFFETHSQALGEVFDAASCREGWLHGELFRWFRFHKGFDTFVVNSLWISDSQKSDFSADEPTRLVGEIKVLGWEYEPKTVTGGSIKPFLNRVEVPITGADRDLILGPWGLIPDFFRLVDFADREVRDAFLILVIDERSQYDRSLAQALRGINFLERSSDIRFPSGLVRIWSIPAAHAEAVCRPPKQITG
jgi:hypothetical protein